jgi:hypothetical protein
VMWSILYGVVDFSGCGLMRRLCRILLHFLFSSQDRWGNLLCDGGFHYHGTCSMEVSLCMGLGRALGHGSKLRLSGCIGGIFDRKSLGFFPVKAHQSSSPSSLVVCNHQSRYCAHASSSYVGYHYNRVLELRMVPGHRQIVTSSYGQLCITSVGQPIHRLGEISKMPHYRKTTNL